MILEFVIASTDLYQLHHGHIKETELSSTSSKAVRLFPFHFLQIKQRNDSTSASKGSYYSVIKVNELFIHVRPRDVLLIDKWQKDVIVVVAVVVDVIVAITVIIAVMIIFIYLITPVWKVFSHKTSAFMRIFVTEREIVTR